MAHLRNRFCLVPFCELSDCPEAVHHAIGSPHFDSVGRPLFVEPIIIAVRADIADTNLPRCSALAASCNTRPYHSYGPVMRKIFEGSQPHNYREVRHGMEGVMEVGDVREIPAGGLIEQTERILLGCVTPMTGATNPQILHTVLSNFAKKFATLSPGCTLRMPIIGTGTARKGEDAMEANFREVVDATLSHFYPSLIPANDRVACRRLIVIHPLEYESTMLAAIVAEKAIFLTLLDKMGIFTTDQRIVYGWGHGPTPETCFVAAETFTHALDHFDKSLDYLLQGDRKLALKEAAKGAEQEPGLSGMYQYITTFANKKRGLMTVVTKEALSLASEGRVRDAFCVANALNHFGAAKKEKDFITALRECYIAYCVAGLESRLLYEHYMQAEEALVLIYKGAATPEQSFVPETSELKERSVPKELLEDVTPLNAVEQKIPDRLIENSLHIVIRKLMADQVETQGPRRALDNLLDFHKRGKITLTAEQETLCQELYAATEFVDKNKESMPQVALQQQILDKLNHCVAWHGTFQLEAARFHLRGGQSDHTNRAKTLTRSDILEAWAHLEQAQKEHPRDFGILSYIGFLIYLQGGKFMRQAEEFYLLFAKVLDDELSQGRFGMRKLKSPMEGDVCVPLLDPLSQNAYAYYDKYRDHARYFTKFAKALSDSEATAAINLYRQAVDSLGAIGRYDLAKLYDEILGETWVALLCRNRMSGSIPIPFIGELPLDLVLNMYRKARYWWKYRNIKTPELHTAIDQLMAKIRKNM